MDNEPKDVRLPLMVTKSEAKAIDDWRFAHRIPSRAEAIRILINAGLYIPTVASMVAEAAKAEAYSLKDNPELTGALETLERHLKQHFDKLPD